METCLFHLLANAIKFNSRGNILVSISYVSFAEKNVLNVRMRDMIPREAVPFQYGNVLANTRSWGYMVVQISDAGIGIPKKKMKTMFQTFNGNVMQKDMQEFHQLWPHVGTPRRSKQCIACSVDSGNTGS